MYIKSPFFNELETLSHVEFEAFTSFYSSKIFLNFLGGLYASLIDEGHCVFMGLVYPVIFLSISNFFYLQKAAFYVEQGNYLRDGIEQIILCAHVEVPASNLIELAMQTILMEEFQGNFYFIFFV